MTDILKKFERKHWNFEQGFETKESKKQIKIKVCHENVKLTVILNKFERKIEILSRGLGRK